MSRIPEREGAPDPTAARWSSPIPLTGNEIIELLLMLGKRLERIEVRLTKIEAELQTISGLLSKERPRPAQE